MRAALSATVVLLSLGCGRERYRAQADQAAFAALKEHVAAPALDPGRIALEREAESRLHAPPPPACPVMPADDPAARTFMDAPNGIANAWPPSPAELPAETWRAGLKLGADGKAMLDAPTALALGLRHSREYQTEAENLYLAALGLTLNRFDFDVQPFARAGTTVALNGAAETRSNTLTLNRQLGFTRALASGGQLLVDFANAFVVDFNGPTRATTSLALGLTQPLLRGAGRQFRLENLVQAEREVLYQLRSFARFRKQFWAGIAVQDGGYLSLLLTLQTIRNQQANLTAQEQNFRLHEELFRNGGQVSVVQVDQAFQSWQAARVAVLQAENSLQNALDDFKLRLGLPLDVELALDDAPLKPFQLSADDLEKLRTDLENLQKKQNQSPDGPPALATARGLHRQLKEAAAALAPWIGKVEAERRAWAAARKSRPARTEVGDDAAAQRDDEADRKFAATLMELKAGTPKLADEIAASEKRWATEMQPKPRGEEWKKLLQFTTAATELCDQLLAIQTQVRINRLSVRAVPYQEAEALKLAREQRLDLQNQRARRMDAWRKVEVAANRLTADVSLAGNATIATRGTSANPFAYDARAGRFSLGLQFDSPLVRQAERNAYRAALVEYQRGRRATVDLEDRIDRAVRGDLRALRLQRQSFEISRQSLLASARQVEGARERLRGRGRDLSGGSSTLDILNALNTLLGARNSLAANYIQYEQQRVQLLLDLEQLPIGAEGAPPDDSEPAEPQPAANASGADDGKPDDDGKSKPSDAAQPKPGDDAPALGTPVAGPKRPPPP